MKRRTFLRALLGTGFLGMMPDIQAFPSASPQVLGGGRVVFLSDLHIHAEDYQIGHLQKIVHQLLSMNPLPEHVVCLGDLAHLTGQIADYESLKPLLEPLQQAGIQLTLAMGNHDRREEFAQVFPEQAAQSCLKDRYTYKISLPEVDILVLDSLNQGDDKTTWITPGILDEEQKNWLQQELNGRQKPVLVCAHHPIHELGIESMLVSCPQCCGYIHGHDHRWRPDWSILNYKTPLVMRRLCLPSAAFWGDIGYCVMHILPDKLTVELHQDDFFFPEPLPENQEVPVQWKMIVEDHQGQTCSFKLRK